MTVGHFWFLDNIEIIFVTPASETPICLYVSRYLSQCPIIKRNRDEKTI
jgi:hypothetical protein